MSIRDELLALKNADDMILGEDAVGWARENPNSDLHGALEWNNDKSAHEHRLWQVRRLIAIHVVSAEGTRQLVSLSTDRHRPGGGFRHIDDVLPVRELREVLLEDALRELQRVEARYKQVTELAEIWVKTHEVRRRRGRPRAGAAQVGPAPEGTAQQA
jgi:hypothetical protein